MTKKFKKKKNLMKIKVSQSDTLPYYVGYFLALFIALKKNVRYEFLLMGHNLLFEKNTT